MARTERYAVDSGGRFALRVAAGKNEIGAKYSDCAASVSDAGSNVSDNGF